MNINDVPIPSVAAVSKAIGLGVVESRKLLAEMTDEKRERIVAAAQAWNAGKHEEFGARLVDPIENDPNVAPLIKLAEVEARREIEQEFLAEFGADGKLAPEDCPGHCHHVWNKTKQILERKYAIHWYTPAEMNPGTFFD